MYRSMGSSDSCGDTSPRSDRNGAPNRWSAVGELSSLISHLTCWDISSRFRSGQRTTCQQEILRLAHSSIAGNNEQCSCLPVKAFPGGGAEGSLLVRRGSDIVALAATGAPFSPLSAEAMARRCDRNAQGLLTRLVRTAMQVLSADRNQAAVRKV